MFRVIACVVQQHNLWLVCAAALVCVLAWGGALLTLDRVAGASLRLRQAWIFLTALAAGGGTWATHFVAMLAYRPGLTLGFDVGLTLLSALIGIGGAWVAIMAFTRVREPWRSVVAGLLMGSAIAGLHFMGMASVEAAARQVWAADLIIASLALVAAFSIAAFTVLARRAARSRVLAGGLFVLGVVTLHFTAMGALTLVPDPRVLAPSHFLLDDAGLGVAISVGAAALMLAAGLISVADRRFAAAKIMAAERTQRLANAAFEGLVIHDSTTIRDANARMTVLLGWSTDELVGKSVADIVPPESRAALLAAAKGQRSFPVEVTILGKDGPVEVEIHRRVFNAEEGLYVSAVRDLSLKRRAEDAERADAAKSHFIADMSHELRTPLNAIMGYAELLGEESAEPATQEDARRIHASASHLLALINEILDMSKIEAGRMDLNLEACDVTDLARAVIDTMRPLALARNNKLDLNPAEIGVLARADAFRLKQCLLNLVSNALKFTEAGRVDITIARRAGRIEIAVRDTGIGMSAAQLAHVFEPFKQADASISRRYGGTGLGLSITRKLMAIMEGEIEVASAPGAGAKFTLILPCAYATAETAA